MGMPVQQAKFLKGFLQYNVRKLEEEEPANVFSLLAHLNRRLIGELIVYEGNRRPPVCQHFQTTSPLKP